MNQQRKDTIIREIKYWKQNQLLPDHYCDFLLALYSEGEVADADTNEETSSKDENKSFSVFSSLFVMLNLIIVPGVVSFIYFFNLSTILVLSLVAITSLICFGFYYIGLTIHELNPQYVLGILLLNTLLISIILVDQWSLQIWLSLAIVLSQILFWIYLGIKKSSRLLIGMGIIGLLSIVIATII